MTKLQYLIMSVVLIVVTGCGTVGGAVSGAGQDLSKAGDWIRTR
jgi:predicted small secreted protein